MTEEEVMEFEQCDTQLVAMIEQMSSLSKKSPNDAVNKFKLKLINELLDRIVKILGEDYLPFNDFSSFEEEDLPSNSDVLLILSQFTAAMKLFHYENVMWDGNQYAWIVDGKESDIKTHDPQKR